MSATVNPEIELFEANGGIAVHPTCASIYASTSNVLKAVAVDRATGSLSPLSTFVRNINSLALDPSGKFLYGASGVVQVFQLDPDTGAMLLETVAAFQAGVLPIAIIVIP